MRGSLPARPPLLTRRRLAWVAVGGLAAAAWLIGFRPQGVTLLQAGLAAGILIAGTVPFLIFLAGKHPAPIPIFPVAGLFYAVCFGLPVFLAEIIWPTDGGVIHYHSVVAADRAAFLDVRALGLVLAGVILSIAFYYLSAKAFPRRMPRLRLPAGDQTPRLILLLGLLLAGHVAFLFVPLLRTLPSIGQFLEPVGYLAFGGFYWLWRDGRISRRSTLLIFGLILPVVILKKLAGGLLTPVILVGLFFFFLMIFFRNRTALAIVALCAGLVIGGYGPMTEFRLNIWGNPTFAAYPLGEKLVHAFDYRRPGLSLGEKLAGSVGMVAHRLSFIAMFSHVVDRTPKEVPFWEGATYKPLSTSFVPRVIWPGKPEERAGRQFGLAYGFTVPASQTSMNMPWIVEMFVNFGVPGVLIGMALVGVLMAFLDRAFNRPDMTPLEAVVGLSVIVPLAYPESNFSVMTGSLLPLVLALWAYFRFGLTAFPGLERRFPIRTGRR